MVPNHIELEGKSLIKFKILNKKEIVYMMDLIKFP